MRIRCRMSAYIHCVSTICLALGAISNTMPATSEPIAADSNADHRAMLPPQNLDTPRSFPKFTSLTEWKKQREEIRQRILVSCGLYPMPRKTPLKTRIFGRVARDGYTIEKVAFETYPGFYLAGNLYRPHGTSVNTNKHPGVLIAHGHWSNGRMANEASGSISARAITFAREGIVAFTFDMVGYNDTRQISHSFANDKEHWVWGVSLMGLQAWNSIRALDFLISLPDVDSKRLAITGESGGGTQTMILGAIDDRLAAVGPCVMVSHSMQGGCLCENAPGLRVEFSNMEVAACAAPKPQIMVGATGDWTRTMMTIEGPGVAGIYKLYGKPENLKYTIFDYGHNINKTSREAVYTAFGKWLLNLPGDKIYSEPPYTMETVADLRVFPDDTPMPRNAVSADALTANLKGIALRGLAKAIPGDSAGLVAFKTTYIMPWRQTLGLHEVAPATIARSRKPLAGSEGGEEILLGREGAADSIPALLFSAEGSTARAAVVVTAASGGINAHWNRQSGPSKEIRHLQQIGVSVLLVDCFLTGSAANAELEAARRTRFGVYFDTYNFTNLQERVHDLSTSLDFLRSEYRTPVVVAGSGDAGLWALLVAPLADGVVADVNHIDLTSDAAFVTDDLYVPCLRHLGDFGTAATLGAPNPLAIYNADAKFTAAASLKHVYQALDRTADLTISTEPPTDGAIERVVKRVISLGEKR